MNVLVNHIKGCFDEFESNGICSFNLTNTTKERFTHDKALEYAKQESMRLLTKNEMHILVGAGVLNQGDKSFWSSSSVRTNGRNIAWLFNGNYGSINYFNRINDYAVRCVGR